MCTYAASWSQGLAFLSSPSVLVFCHWGRCIACFSRCAEAVPRGMRPQAFHSGFPFSTCPWIGPGWSSLGTSYDDNSDSSCLSMFPKQLQSEASFNLSSKSTEHLSQRYKTKYCCTCVSPYLNWTSSVTCSQEHSSTSLGLLPSFLHFLCIHARHNSVHLHFIQIFEILSSASDPRFSLGKRKPLHSV